MYEYITGRVETLSPTAAVLEAGGIGYWLNISLQTFSQIGDRAEGTGAVVSLLENKGRLYLLIVNRDYECPMRLTFYADESVGRVLKDGSIVPAQAYTGVLEVDPGDAMIYTWTKKRK